MFCPKCGTQNPDEGVFCRACGTRLSNATSPLVGAPTAQVQRLVGKRIKPISYESAIAKIFSGLAFIVVACILGYTQAAGGRGWWFWLLIPGFGSLGRGVAQWVQIKNSGSGGGGFVDPAIRPEDQDRGISAAAAPNLPPAQEEWVSAESRYKTGDLVPPSVTDSTTRHLEIDADAQATKPLK